MATKARARIYPHDRFLGATLLRLFPAWITPNIVTAVRLAGTPFVWWLLYDSQYAWGLPLFMLLAFTDTIDGSLARTRKQITPWGIVFDPIADKLLIGGVGLIFGLRFFAPPVIFAMVIFDIMPAVRYLMAREPMTSVPMQANWWGKSKMILQCLAILTLLIGVVFSVPALIPIAHGILWVAVGLAAIAVVTYSL